MVGIYCFFGLPPPIFVKKPLTLLEYICLSSKSGPFLPDLALFVTKTRIHGQQVLSNLAFRPHVWRNSLLCDRFYPSFPKNLAILPYWTSFLANFWRFPTLDPCRQPCRDISLLLSLMSAVRQFPLICVSLSPQLKDINIATNVVHVWRPSY